MEGSILLDHHVLVSDRTHVFSDSTSSNSDLVAFPSCIINGSAVTKTFQILYRNEEVRLESVANFKVHVVAETGKVRNRVCFLVKLFTCKHFLKRFGK